MGPRGPGDGLGCLGHQRDLWRESYTLISLTVHQAGGVPRERFPSMTGSNWRLVGGHAAE